MRLKTKSAVFVDVVLDPHFHVVLAAKVCFESVTEACLGVGD